MRMKELKVKLAYRAGFYESRVMGFDGNGSVRQPWMCEKLRRRIS